MQPAVTEHLLLPALSLQGAIDHVERHAVDADRDTVVDAWRDAERLMRQIAEQEAGCADDPGILPIPPELSGHVEALVSSSGYQECFARVPVMFGMIEVDATMAGRARIVDDRRRALAEGLAQDVDDACLMRTCLPADTDETDDRVDSDSPGADAGALDTLCGPGSFTVVTDDLETRLLRASRQPGASSRASFDITFGRPPAAVHALRFDGRLMLADGHLRASVLRTRGHAFVPALISVCESLDDVRAAAPGLDGIDLARVFASPRPPMLRDFGRARLVHAYAARRLRRMLEIRYSLHERWIP